MKFREIFKFSLINALRNKILKILEGNKNIYLSGEKICNELGVSRTAIWKYIRKLREDGYTIESATNKGYRLIDSPNSIDYPYIERGLKTTHMGRHYHLFKEIDSTNNYCKNLAINKAKEGTLVISESQALGRGRQGRCWSSPNGKGLWFSLLLRPNIEPLLLGFLTQVSSAALYLTFKDFGIESKIKWPNDIILNNKKLCGILTEVSCELSIINYVILGIGINVNLDESDFSSELSKIATSLKIQKGSNLSRADILSTFLNYFEIYYNKFLEGSIDEILKICKENSYILGKKVNIINNNSISSVIPIDILRNGTLLVKTEDGTEKVIYSGEISLRLKD